MLPLAASGAECKLIIKRRLAECRMQQKPSRDVERNLMELCILRPYASLIRMVSCWIHRFQGLQVAIKIISVE